MFLPFTFFLLVLAFVVFRFFLTDERVVAMRVGSGSCGFVVRLGLGGLQAVMQQCETVQNMRTWA